MARRWQSFEDMLTKKVAELKENVREDFALSSPEEQRDYRLDAWGGETCTQEEFERDLDKTLAWLVKLDAEDLVDELKGE